MEEIKEGESDEFHIYRGERERWAFRKAKKKKKKK